jgi:hypothetical protein
MIENLPELIAAGVSEASEEITARIDARLADQAKQIGDALGGIEARLLDAAFVQSAAREEASTAVDKAAAEIRGEIEADRNAAYDRSEDAKQAIEALQAKAEALGKDFSSAVEMALRVRSEGEAALEEKTGALRADLDQISADLSGLALSKEKEIEELAALIEADRKKTAEEIEAARKGNQEAIAEALQGFLAVQRAEIADGFSKALAASQEAFEAMREELAGQIKALETVRLEERALHAERLEEVRREARSEIEREIERRAEKLAAEIRGAALSMPVPSDWQARAYYQGEAARHAGGTWIARRKTEEEPGRGDDWTILADGIAEIARGNDNLIVIRSSGDVIDLGDVRGPQGKGFVHRGLYKPDEKYSGGDVVLADGSSFVALKDEPGSIPGAGWEMLAQRGRKGKQGEQGLRGEKGLDGSPAPSFVEQIGAWRDGIVTEPGALVAHAGKLFIAIETTTAPPGIGDAWLAIRSLGQ